jgi:hypothetical protein
MVILDPADASAELEDDPLSLALFLADASMMEACHGENR